MKFGKKGKKKRKVGDKGRDIEGGIKEGGRKEENRERETKVEK